MFTFHTIMGRSPQRQPGSGDSDFPTSSDKNLIDRGNSGFKNTSIENIGVAGFVVPFLADLSPISANLRRFLANLTHVFAELTAIFANLISGCAKTILGHGPFPASRWPKRNLPTKSDETGSVWFFIICSSNPQCGLPKSPLRRTSVQAPLPKLPKFEKQSLDFVVLLFSNNFGGKNLMSLALTESSRRMILSKQRSVNRNISFNFNKIHSI
ncbi:MAG TPA: hypothetical protein VG759_27075 [Candidatus Angelobacter sp.]|jgi:hypothetical protein|nr:hypothetical protein [Candidatus Angelobacter sp.]